MAAFVTTITLSNGMTLSAAGNATAIGVPLNVSLSGVASSTSPIDFTVPTSCFISDIVTTATAGITEIFSNYKRSGKTINHDARFGYAMDRKAVIPRIGFRPGVKYSLVVTETTS